MDNRSSDDSVMLPDRRAEPTFTELLGDQNGLIQALASIQLKGKQKQHLEQLFASADGEGTRRDAGNRIQCHTRHSCSLVGGSLTRYFGGVGPTDNMMWIGHIERDAYDEERWVMRPQIRSSLVHLGWFGPGPSIPSATAPANNSAALQSTQDKADPTYEQALLAAVQKSFHDYPAMRAARLADAPRVPEKYQLTTTAFRRNADVIAEVLTRAVGNCETCLAPAPFQRASNGMPYLEVHHMVPLAAGGCDTVENAVAICPNCHRKAHYGSPVPAGASGASGGSLQ